MDDQSFRKLLDHMGGDWAGYRKVRKGVKKRISRHMQQLGCRKTAHYLSLIDADPAVKEECKRRMTVAVSRFFRDRMLWDRLVVLLFSGDTRRRAPVVRIWSAGCASGEEVYSLKILEAQHGQGTPFSPVLSILATDKNPENLRRAEKGRYPASSLKELSPDTVSAYFESQRQGRRYAVSPVLRDNIEWRRHDLLDAPPEETFFAVFLRNSLLTYYKEETRKTALARILKHLEPGGLLVIGSHERLPEGFGYMVQDPLCPHVFVRSRSIADPVRK